MISRRWWQRGLPAVCACGTLLLCIPLGTLQAQPAGSLKTGEYACYGSGGRILIGLGFKVPAAGQYTDLDGKSSGTFSVEGSQISFRGGHLDGQTGRDLKNNHFRISSASCEPS